MLQFSVNETTTFRWSFEEDVQNYVASGIQAISVWRHKLSDFGDEKGAELLADNGMTVASLLWAGGFTGSEGRSFKESLEDAFDAVRQAALRKAGCLIVYTGGRAGHTHKHVRRLVTGALIDLAGLAEELGVTLALEPMHAGCASEFTFLTDLGDALSMIDLVGSPQLKLVFDTYHFGQCPGVLERIPQLVPRIAIVQLGDAKRPPAGEQNRCRLGDGAIPLREIVSSLASNGYTGFYDIELLGEDVEAGDYRELLLQTKQAYADLFRMAGAS